MYTKGLQLGDDSYLLQDDDELVLATTNGTPNQMEEYIQISNQYEEKLEEKFYLTDKLSEVHDKEIKAKKININTFIITFLMESFFIALCVVGGIFPIEMLIFVPTMCISTGLITRIEKCGTKKKRKRQKKEISEEIFKIKNELKELQKKKDTLKNEIEYSEMGIYEDFEMIPITTVENKKANVKIRVLSLDQSR